MIRFKDAGPKIMRVGEKFRLVLWETEGPLSGDRVKWEISPPKSQVVRRWFTKDGQSIEGMKPGTITVRAYIKGKQVCKHVVKVLPKKVEKEGKEGKPSLVGEHIAGLTSDERAALTMYSALMRIGMVESVMHGSERAGMERIERITSETLRTINTEHTKLIQKVLGIGDDDGK